MSSFIGHLSAGAAVYFSQARFNDVKTRCALPLLIGLAVSPDFDYLPYWMWGVKFNPRITHSLAFCLLLSGLSWLFTKQVRTELPKFPGIIALSIASCSHVALDLLVGVHAVPVLWPLSQAELSSPLGLLPSAGHLSFTNYYFWRNLVIECGVLLPFFLFAVVVSRGLPLALYSRKFLFLGAIWLGFLAWSIHVHT